MTVNSKGFPKIVIFGCRGKYWENPDAVRGFVTNLVQKTLPPFQLVCGMEKTGVDGWAHLAYQGRNDCPEPLEYPANWRPDPSQPQKIDFQAGFRRNVEMAEVAAYGYGVWDGKSAGTLHMMGELLRRGKLRRVYFPESNWNSRKWGDVFAVMASEAREDPKFDFQIGDQMRVLGRILSASVLDECTRESSRS